MRKFAKKLHDILPKSLYYFLAELYRMPRQLLKIDFIRFVICYIRKLYFIVLMRRLKTMSPLPEGVSINTITHNVKGIADVAVRRSYRLIHPVMTIDRVFFNAQNMKVLTIGPRAEGEIFNLIAHGFAAKNIRGLDLISYSPFVDLGDMHDLPYEDNSFDLIFAGWVLSYSDDKQKAVDEMLRVAKDGAIIAIGLSATTLTNDEIKGKLGYLPGSEEVMLSTKDLHKYFKNNIKYTYFQQEFGGDNPDLVYQIISVFTVKKDN